MDTLSDLLQQRPSSEPPQIQAIKGYISKKYDEKVSVRVHNDHYSLAVPNAALAHRLRIDTPEIITVCNLDKKLVIRIGQ